MEINNVREPVLESILAKTGILMTVTILYRSFDAIINRGVAGQTEGSSVLSLVMMVLIVLAGLSLVVFSTDQKDNVALIWVAFIFSVLCVLFTFFSNLYSVSRMGGITISISFWTFVLIASYYSVRYNKSIKNHVILVLLSFPILFYFILTRASIVDQFSVINLSYYILYLLPIALLTKSRVISYSSILMTVAVVMLSYKRAGMLAIITAVVVYSYYENRQSATFKRKFFGTVVFLSAVILTVAIYISLSSTYNLDWTSRMLSLITDRGSGRDRIYERIIDIIRHQDGIRLLFGNGFNATKIKIGFWAHNDLLEIIFNFGIIVAALYMSFITLLFKIFIKMKKNNYQYYPAFALSLIIFMWGTLLSQMIIFPYWFLGLALFWGITIADYKNINEQQVDLNEYRLE